MSSMSKLQNTQISGKTTAIVIVIFVALVSCGILLIRSRLMGPSEGIQVEQREPAAQREKTDKAGNMKADDTTENKTAPKASKPVDACQIIVQRNIFKPLVKSSVGTPASNRPVPPMPVGMFPVMPGGSFGVPGTPPAGQEKTKIAYTGIVQTPEATLALLEDTSTKETRYAGIGDTAFGMSVMEVNPKYVSLNSMGRIIRLAMGENKPDAQPATTPGAPGPGAPGQPPATPGVQPGQLPPPQMNPAGAFGQMPQNNDASRQRGTRRRNR